MIAGCPLQTQAALRWLRMISIAWLWMDVCSHLPCSLARTAPQDLDVRFQALLDVVSPQAGCVKSDDDACFVVPRFGSSS